MDFFKSVIASFIGKAMSATGIQAKALYQDGFQLINIIKEGIRPFAEDKESIVVCRRVKNFKVKSSGISASG